MSNFDMNDVQMREKKLNVMCEIVLMAVFL